MTVKEAYERLENIRNELIKQLDELAAAVQRLKSSARAVIDAYLESLKKIETAPAVDTSVIGPPDPTPEEPGPTGPPVDRVTVTGPEIRVRSIEALQSALTNAQDGTVIILEPGRYDGEIVAPGRSMPNGVTVRGGGALPSDTVICPRRERTGLTVMTDARNWRFENFRIEARGHQLAALVLIGSHTEVSPSRQPENIVLKNLDIIADPVHGSFRGIALHGQRTTIEGCVIRGFKSEFESQAIAGWNGPGPYIIRDCTMSASGEVIIFGGAPARIGRNPGSILIENCILEKTPDMLGPRADGRSNLIKNIFELKRAERVKVRNCTFRNSYHGAHSGFAVVLTVRTERGENPFGAVLDVVFENCQFLNCGAGVNILGADDLGNGHYGVLEGVRFVNCRFDINRSLGGAARVWQVLSGARSVAFENCEVTGDPKLLLIVDGPPTDKSPYDPDFKCALPIVGLSVRDCKLRGPVHGRGFPWAKGIETYVRGFSWSGNIWTDGTVPPKGFPPRV